MLDRMTANLQFHGQALELRAERQQVLASNIANADTPNYQARDFDFSRTLRQALGGASSAGMVSTAMAPAGMTPAGSAPAGPARTTLALAAPDRGAVVTRSGGGAELMWRQPDQPSIDGNTVDLDRERASFADNSLRYEATVRFINGSMRNMLSAIRGE
jgi:flagellar basal-body rod protein FlgB